MHFVGIVQVVHFKLGIDGSTREQVLGDRVKVQSSNRSGMGFIFKDERGGCAAKGLGIFSG